MFIDLSLLKNIDFTNRDNIIFLSILLVLAIFVVAIFLWTVSELIKVIKRIINRLFNIDPRPKFDKNNNTEWLHQSKNDGIDKEIENLKSSVTKPVVDFNVINKKPEEEKTDIAKGLSKLKSNNIIGGGLEAKMPSRVIAQEGDKEKIDIPIPTHNSEGFRQGVGSFDHPLPSKGESDFDENSPVMFEGGSEISRMELRHKLKYDPEIYKAQKEAGLYNFSRADREKLEKEVFAPVYGRNISKSDLKQSVRTLNRKMIGTTDAKEHAKLRKEIKFFKKIGGIK